MLSGTSPNDGGFNIDLFAQSATGNRLTWDGMNFPGSRDDPEASGRALIELIDAESEFDLVDVKHGVASSHAYFQQTVDGLPVFGSAVSTHQGPNGEVQTLHLDAYSGINSLQQTAATLSAEEAIFLAAVTNDVTTIAGEPTAELVWYPTGDNSAELAWQTDVTSYDGVLGNFRTVVDADSGDILFKTNRMAFATGTGDVYDPNPFQTQGSGNGLDDNNDANSAALEAQLISVSLERLNDGTGLLIGDWVDLATLNSPDLPDNDADESTRIYEYTRDDDRFEQVVIYYAIDSMQAYFHELGYDDDEGVQNGIRDYPTLANAHWFTDDQSFYDPGNDAVHFGDGGVDDGEDADIIAHEYGHAIQHNQNPAWGGGEMGAMGEGFGDYLAASFYFDAGDAGYQNTNAACVGEWDATEYDNSSPPCLRRVDGNKVYPDDLVGQVHADGEIWSRALWDIRAAIGGQTTDQLVLEHHFALPASSLMPDAANAILAADQNLNDGANQAEILQAFVERGILETGPAGLVSFETDLYGVGDTATITLRDSDLIGLSSVDVDVTTSNGDVETVSLTALGAGEFSGTIDSRAALTEPGNGILDLANNEVVTVTYFDDDNGSGGSGDVTDTATYVLFTNILEADFSDDNGNEFNEGFRLSGSANEWHLSQGRGTAGGHSADDSFYFGSGENANGGGTHDNDADGTLTSPQIDLTDASTALLSFNYFLEIEEGFDFATVTVISGGQSTEIANSEDATLPDASEFRRASFDLTSFVGNTIEIAFRFTSDGSVTYEGWYVDDVLVRAVIPLPDLEVTEVRTDPSGDGLVEAGEEFDAEIDVTNTGDSNITSTSELEFYASEDEFFDPGDVFLGQETVDPLAAGATQTVTRTVVVPANGTTGTWHILGIADAFAEVNEESEANNVSSGTIEIQPLDPDDQIAEANTAAIGDSIDDSYETSTDVDVFSFVVEQDQRVAFDVDLLDGDFDSYLRLFTAQGVELAFNNDAAGPDPETNSEAYVEYTFRDAGTFFISVSSAANSGYDPLTGFSDTADNSTGNYELTILDLGPDPVDPDDEIAEANPADFDSDITGFTIDFPKDVDLFSFNVSAGDRIGFDIDRIPGSGLDSFLRLFDSTGAEIASNDNASGLDPEIAPEDSYIDYTFASGGTYYVGVSGIGNTAYDANTGADDEATATFGEFTLRLHSLVADLNLTTLELVDETDNQIEAGSTFGVSADYSNDGLIAATGFSRDYFLSDDPQFSPDDLPLFAENAPSLGAGESTNTTATLEIPANTTAGDWYIVLFLDSVNNLRESDDTNNQQAVSIHIPAGFTVSPEDITVGEDGTSALFEVQLTTAPASDVVFTLESDNPEIVLVSETVTFTPTNWQAPRAVAVTGADDDFVDGDATGQITVTIDTALSDDAFDALPSAQILAKNEDDEIAGFEVSSTTGDVSEDGGTETVDIALTARPFEDVVLNLAADDPDELTVDVMSLTFTSANWDVPQQATIGAVDDQLVDGTVDSAVSVQVDASSSPSFAGLLPQNVIVSSADNDVAEFAVVETDGSTSTTEDGQTDTIEIVLTAAPVTDVVFAIEIAATSQAVASPQFHTATRENWNMPHVVTVSSVDDDLADGDLLIITNISVVEEDSDPAFAGLETQSVLVESVDNEVAGFTVDADATITISESGANGRFTVALDAAPRTPVVMDVLSNAAEASVSPAILTFDEDNWNTPQEITVAAVDDQRVDGDVESGITIRVDPSASDSAFDALDSQSVAVTILDNDEAGFTVTETDASTLVREDQLSDTISIVLDAEPAAPVILNLLSDNADQAIAEPAALTFTSSNWNVPQGATISGVEESTVDGDANVTITVEPSTTSDPSFTGLDARTINVTAEDPDVAGFQITETDGDTTISETDLTDTIRVTLQAQPLTDVVLDLAVSDDTEVELSRTSLTFSPDNWNVPQVVTLNGLSDFENDGDMTSAVTVSVNDATSDAAFVDLTDQTVSVTSVDVVEFSLDVDGDNQGLALTDGILIIRYLAGFSGNSLTANAVNEDGTRATEAGVTSWLDPNRPFLDVDGDGAAQPLTDGILTIRYLAGFSGDSLINGAVSAGGTRTTAEAVTEWLDLFAQFGSGSGGAAAALRTVDETASDTISAARNRLETQFGEPKSAIEFPESVRLFDWRSMSSEGTFFGPLRSADTSTEFDDIFSDWLNLFDRA